MTNLQYQRVCEGIAFRNSAVTVVWHRYRRGPAKAWRAFTLVEVLVVIAIMGVLIQLMIPAVQAARESARKLECRSNLRQIGLAMQQHEAALKHLPTAGWGWAWIGDPERGSGSAQPGSWAYQLLPYLDESNVHDISSGATGEKKIEELTRLASIPVGTFYCPSRRPASATPNVGPQVRAPNMAAQMFWFNAAKASQLARTDYAANIGDVFVFWNRGPTLTRAEIGQGFLNFRDLNGVRRSISDITGVVVQREPFTLAQVADGTSKTYFAGEKYLSANMYESGKSLNDDQSCWNGDDLDLMASVELPPSQDFVPNYTMVRTLTRFGSAHLDGLNMVFCDGSVHFVSYQINPSVHRQLGNRRDGQPVSQAF